MGKLEMSTHEYVRACEICYMKEHYVPGCIKIFHVIVDSFFNNRLHEINMAF